MKRLLSLVAFFATLQASAQQVNPVPDYVFANRMSAGRNTVTDTAAYLSIGPRYGATRGMMPPMVVDTASFSGNKRNGLLIFSIQKNKFLYWDSVGVKWAEMAGTGGSAITGAGVAGYMPEFTTATNLDSTSLYHSAGRFAIGSTTTSNGRFSVFGGQSYFDTSLKVGSQTLLADEGKNEVYINTNTDAGAYALQVNGNGYYNGHIDVNTSGQSRRISTFYGSNSDGNNIYVGGGGSSSVGAVGESEKGSYNNSFGVNALQNVTTGYQNTGVGFHALRLLTTGVSNVAFGAYSLLNHLTGNSNVAIGTQSLRNSTTGYQRIAIGASALYSDTSGYNNVAIGYQSMFGNLSGYNNIAMGSSTLEDLSTGYENVAIGNRAIQKATTANNLIAIGTDAGRLTSAGTLTTTSTSSILIGNDARGSANGNTNEIVIGHTGRGNGNNTVTFGNSSTTQNYFNGAINTTAPSSGSTKPWKLGEAATVSPTSPNRTIRVEIDGTVYYIHAKTTND